MKPVYVVGYGMIDSLGNNPKDCFDKMLDNHDYSSDLPELKAENAKVFRGAIFNPDDCIIPKNFDIKIKENNLINIDTNRSTNINK